MKNNIKRTALAVALLGLAGTAAAAQDTLLTVTGTIKSPACEVVIDGLGIVDFSDISDTLLSATDTAGIRAIDTNAVVNCLDDTLVMLKVTDRRAGQKPTTSMNFKFDGSAIPGTSSSSHGTDYVLGLGTTTNAAGDDKPIGGYMLAFGRPFVDNNEADYISTNATGAPAYAHTSQQSVYFHQTAYTYFGASKGGTAGNINFVGKEHKFPIAVAISLNKRGEILNGANIPLDGEATLEVVYL